MHEGGIRVEALKGGGFRFVRPDGRPFDRVYREAPLHHAWSDLGASNAAHGIPIDANTAATRWLGERMDFGWGVSLLCAQHERAHRPIPDHTVGVSAETPTVMPG